MKNDRFIGQKFSMLTYLHEDANGKAYFQCDCGNKKSINRSHVTNGRIQSCGCLRRNRKDCLVGQQFGYLTVDSYITNKGYQCRCVCGVTKNITAQSLKNGSSKSCGCMQNSVENLSGKWFQDLYVIRRLTDISEVKHKYKNKAFWICCCKCGKRVILDTAKLKTQKSCGCNNVAHVQKSNSKRYPYLYKCWHRYKQLDQLSEEFLEFADFLDYVLKTVGDREFSYSYLTTTDSNKIGIDNLVYKHKQHNIEKDGVTLRWCTSCEEYVELSDEFWSKKKTSGCRKCVHASILKRKYNLDYSDYLQMRQDCNNRCQICKKDKPLVVDHCHTTGKVRGLLCSQCNSGLGHIKDNIDHLKKMIEYLERGTTDIDWIEYPCQRKHDPVDDTCPITGEVPEVLDHCHDTGKVRGNIGWSANIALGHFKDDKEVISSAMTYLTNV